MSLQGAWQGAQPQQEACQLGDKGALHGWHPPELVNTDSTPQTPALAVGGHSLSICVCTNCWAVRQVAWVTKPTLKSSFGDNAVDAHIPVLPVTGL